MVKPFTSMEQRYNDQADRKAQLKKKYEEELRKNFKPFKARTVDPKVLQIKRGDIKRMLQEQDEKRKVRVNNRAIWLLQNSHLPNSIIINNRNANVER